mmetsp:Transcript_8435/g.17556  ORF Transcript_8435/g.17556 Transcript_8435/m.17556 type:complete len:352 (+) Transcript_8435:165-1220(+)|eukprot:CAMPEP_0201117252 /NCGR_PEP_ID=MMETSP0850-20130426/1262_1 /ASSEMBLY_ACC=CAM_ASM_000622 /TAXON_ID=183588 /ORGANISM="Pseudo-nitzschia fraudulenta, Strain WWA7" /LENGTH=351 /DNA_ID=CAMNT_0047381503 /DNA_START=122 /DNA_END=1177 /DNA_ORIENTATION=-
MELDRQLGHNEHVQMDETRHDSNIHPTTDQNAAIETNIGEEKEVSFFHDFIAGGIAGSASVVVGHPMDTLKVRMQTSKGNPSIPSLVIGSKYGGPMTLFSGMGAPLSAACVVNALIFSSYGWSSRLYEQYSPNGFNPTVRSFTCGAFAGFVQAVVICPMEHVKCRLQIAEAAGSAKAAHPLQATFRAILTSGGSNANIGALYRGWWITCWREIPAFGGYFALYDIFKDGIQESLDKLEKESSTPTASIGDQQHNNAHTWIASAMGGGLTGALTWAIVYPFDVIKTQIQTAPIDTPRQERTIAAVYATIVKENGSKHLFRGLSVTCARAFPVNAIIFPVYEYTLLYVCAWES